ncbi:MAG: hypothetical protein IT289_09335 [Oligoflexia bacterium]|nr:hypothetical protein [Oligoflexia bacterium]
MTKAIYWAILIFTLTSFGAHKARADKTIVGRLNKGFKEVLGKCPERLWPDLNYKDVQFAVALPKEKRAWLWNGKGDLKSFKKMNFDEVMAKASRNRFSVISINNRPTMFLDLEDLKSAKEAFELIVHEAFHAFHQPRFTIPNASGRRGIPFPLSEKLPYFARMMLRTLTLGLMHPELREQKLGEAAFWVKEIESYDPTELTRQRRFEISEGTATYVQAVSGILFDYGCKVSEHIVRQQLIERTRSDAEGVQGAAAEYSLGLYRVGAAALTYLRVTDTKNWERLVENGITPLEVLLRDKKPIASENDPAMLAHFKIDAEIGNQRVAVELSPLLDALNSKDALRLSVPSNWGREFSTGGLYISGLAPNSIAALFLTQSFKNNESVLEVNGVTGFLMPETPCGGTQTVFVMGKDPSFEGSFDQPIVFSAPPLATGKFKIEKLTDSAGLDWICAR